MKDRLAALGAALLFLVCFGGVGAAASWVIGATVRDAYRAEHWVPVAAEVRRADKGDVSYTYTWDGKPYTGSRLGTFVLGGTSDVDDWESRVDAAIRAATEAGKPITVYVDPMDPAESMVDREIRWKLLAAFAPFALAFGGVGLFMGATMLWKAAGLPPVRLNEAVRQFLATGAFALLWNAICVPIAWLVGPDAWDEGEWFAVAIIGFFQLIGVLMLWSVVVLFFKAVAACNPFHARERVDRSGKVLS